MLKVSSQELNGAFWSEEAEHELTHSTVDEPDTLTSTRISSSSSSLESGISSKRNRSRVSLEQCLEQVLIFDRGLGVPRLFKQVSIDISQEVSWNGCARLCGTSPIKHLQQVHIFLIISGDHPLQESISPELRQFRVAHQLAFEHGIIDRT